MAHAKYFGASAAHRWLRCPGSNALSEGIPDQPSSYATEGSALHRITELVLNGEVPESTALIGTEVGVNDESILVTEEMANIAQKEVDFVNEITPDDAIRLIEVRSDYSVPLDQPDAFGTADVVIITDDEVWVIDHKFGAGVQVHSAQNAQLLLYAMGIVEEYRFLREFKRVRLFIGQPRLNHYDEWSCPIAEGDRFMEEAKKRAARTLSHPDELIPGETQCRWCKAKAICPALAKEVDDAFSALPKPDHNTPSHKLSEAMAKLPLVKAWLDAVPAETERRLVRGEKVCGYKLVEGRRGPRKWVDSKKIAETLKQMRVKNDDIYEQKIISPTKAEKLVKDGRIGPRQWNTILQHVTQAEGRPSVVSEDDPRPELKHDTGFKKLG